MNDEQDHWDRVADHNSSGSLGNFEVKATPMSSKSAYDMEHQGDGGGNNNDPWLLGKIGSKEAGGETVYGLGYLMYELPINTVSGMVRKGEVAIGSLIDKGEKTIGEFVGKLRSAGVIKKDEQVSDSMLQNLALHHRKGHIDGLRKVIDETETKLLITLLEKTSGKKDKLNPNHFVYQVAAILEAVGDNVELRDKLDSVLEESEIWKSNKGNLDKFKIPGLNGKELSNESLFKGAILAPLPEPTPSKLNKMFRAWQTNRATSTYNRAMKYIK